MNTTEVLSCLVGKEIRSLDLYNAYFPPPLDLPNIVFLPDGLYVLRGMPISNLNLGGDYEIGWGDAQLELFVGMPLTSLAIKNWHGVTDAGLMYLWEMPLKKLDVSRCPRISYAGLDLLASKRSRKGAYFSWRR